MMRRRGGPDSTQPVSGASPGAFRVACVIAGAFFVLVALALSTPLLSLQARELVSDVGLVPVAALVPVSCLWTARRSHGTLRVGAALLGVAGILWTLGEAGWFVAHYLVGDTGASVADAFYLTAVLPAAAALVVLPPKVGPGRARAISLLGCLVAGGSVLFVAWSILLRTGTPTDAPPDLALFTAYPAADVVLLSLALSAVIRAGNQIRPPLRLVVAGIATYAVADTVYSIASLLGVYTSGSPVDLGWFAGYLLIAIAALHPVAGTQRTPVAGQPHSGLASMLVYVPIVVATIIAAALPPDGPDAILIITGFGLIVAFGIRQVLLAADHAQLDVQRTEQLASVQRSEERLRREVLQTQRITQSVADGIVVVDPDRRVTMTNGPATEMLRRSTTQLQGQLLDDLLLIEPTGGPDTPAAAPSDSPSDTRSDPPPESASASESAGGQAVLDAITDQSVLSAVDTRFHSDNGPVLVEVTVGPIFEHGQSMGTVLVLRDVSARRAVDKLKNEFISVVSHELRTPLTSIRGSLALLDGGVCGVLEPAGARMVTLALQASERLTRLIDDLLDVERLESGALTMEYEECDAARLVDAAVREMRGLAQHQGVELVRGETTGHVMADPDRIAQTLTNLISNAVKFSPTGSRVVIGAAPIPAGDQIEFSVADSGRGIPPEQLETVFERFNQVDSSDSRQRGGTGLGLTICRNIVERHGGRIWVTSELGRGSDFRFVLPAVSPDPGVETRRPVAAPAVS